jgi:hypothetical protein
MVINFYFLALAALSSIAVGFQKISKQQGLHRYLQTFKMTKAEGSKPANF